MNKENLCEEAKEKAGEVIESMKGHNNIMFVFKGKKFHLLHFEPFLLEKKEMTSEEEENYEPWIGGPSIDGGLHTIFIPYNEKFKPEYKKIEVLAEKIISIL